MNRAEWMAYMKEMKCKPFDNDEWHLLQPMLYDLINDAFQWKASLEKFKHKLAQNVPTCPPTEETDGNVKLKNLLDSITMGDYNSLHGGVKQAYNELQKRIEDYARLK